MQKNATPTKAQQAIIKLHGLTPALWTVVKEFSESMIVRHRVTGEFRHIFKK